MRSTKMHEGCDEESGPGGRTLEETDVEAVVMSADSARNQLE